MNPTNDASFRSKPSGRSVRSDNYISYDEYPSNQPRPQPPPQTEYKIPVYKKPVLREPYIPYSGPTPQQQVFRDAQPDAPTLPPQSPPPPPPPQGTNNPMSVSCLDVFSHIKTCPVCNRIYGANNSAADSMIRVMRNMLIAMTAMVAILFIWLFVIPAYKQFFPSDKVAPYQMQPNNMNRVWRQQPQLYAMRPPPQQQQLA